MRLVPLRLARVALAAAAAIAVVAGSWIVIQQSTSDAKRSAELAQAPTTDGGIDGRSNSSASSIAELTLVAMLDNRSIGRAPGAARPANSSGWMTNWVSADRLGDSDAARLAAPVLRTHGAAIDDIESELEAILGVDEANAGASSDGVWFGNGDTTGFSG